MEQCAQGTTLIHQGDEGDRFYVLLDGRASVMRDSQQIADLRPGDQFGEIALLHGVPRRADVVASTPITVLSVGRDDFASALRSRIALG